MREFKFLNRDLTIIREHTYTAFDNKIGTVSLSWAPFPVVNTIHDVPLTFKGNMIQFLYHMLITNTNPIMYKIDLKRGGWFRSHYTYNNPLTTRILKRDDLIIYYDRKN